MCVYMCVAMATQPCVHAYAQIRNQFGGLGAKGDGKSNKRGTKSYDGGELVYTQRIVRTEWGWFEFWAYMAPGLLLCVHATRRVPHEGKLKPAKCVSVICTVCMMVVVFACACVCMWYVCIFIDAYSEAWPCGVFRRIYSSICKSSMEAFVG